MLWNNFWSFCRLRAADRIPKQELAQSEARLRSQQISDADFGRPVPDARLRQKQGISGGSLEANLSRSGECPTVFFDNLKGTTFMFSSSSPTAAAAAAAFPSFATAYHPTQRRHSISRAQPIYVLWYEQQSIRDRRR